MAYVSDRCPQERQDQRSAVGQCFDLTQPQQSLVGSHEGQAEDLSGRRQEPVCGVRVRERELVGRQDNLMGERSFPQVRRRPQQPILPGPPAAGFYL